MSDEEYQQRIKMQCHLLGEAFPGKFIAAIIFDRPHTGKVDVISNVSDEAEKNILVSLLDKISTP